MSQQLSRRLSAVWFADISGFSQRTSLDEDEALHLVDLFQTTCHALVDRFDGRIVKFLGDGALGEFDSVDAAVRAACSVQRAFGERASEAGITNVDLHIGIHLGEVATRPDGDIYGEGVNVASRLQDLAGPGEIIVSEEIRGTLRQRPGFTFRDLGERTIKGYERPIRVHTVEVEPEEISDLRLPKKKSGWRWMVGELQRRHVLPALGLYTLFLALLLVLAVSVLPQLGSPEWTARAVVVAGFLAFPLVIALAWMYDVTPGGIQRTPSPTGETEERRRARLAWLGIGAAVAVAAGTLSALYLPILSMDPLPEPAITATSKLHENRLAVLYFDDFTEAGRLGYLVDGLTETLIQELENLPLLEVVSRNGVKPFRNVDVPVDSVARVLGAGSLVQGSVSESEGLLRVSVQLIDGETGTLLDSETVERPRGELFALQDQLAREVAGFLRRRFGEEVRIQTLQEETESIEAWELVHRAERIKDEALPSVDPESDRFGGQLDHADRLLERATILDPTWSEPIVQRAWLAFERARTSLEPERWIQTGLGHAERALALDPDDPAALEVRGSLRTLRYAKGLEESAREAERLRDAAQADLRAATALDTDRPIAFNYLAWLEASRGESLEAYRMARRAYEADAWYREADDVLWRLFATAYDLPRPQEAREWCQEGSQRFPEDPRFVECRLWLLTMPNAEPDPDGVWNVYEEYVRAQNPNVFDDAVARMGVAAALARAGLADSALAVARRARLDETADPTLETSYYEAWVRTIVGDHTGAIDALSKHLRMLPGARKEAAKTWFFDDLHDDPAFQRLVEADR